MVTQARLEPCEQVGNLRWESLSGMAVGKQAGSSEVLPGF